MRGVDDIELGLPRTSNLAYHCAAPASGAAAGLAFVIPGFGEEANGAALRDLRAHLAQTHGLLAVSVEYHCQRLRLADGARLDFSPQEFAALREVCLSHGVALLDKNALLAALAQLPVAYEFELAVIPPDGEYQNLGLMAALDHLAVLHDLLGTTGARFDAENILALGQGYGGYLAHLIAKLAPNTLRAVFDIAAPSIPSASWLFGGEAEDAAPFHYHLGNIRITPRVLTRWSAERTRAEWYSPARQSLRDTALPAHIATMRQAAERPCRYCMAHAAPAETPFAITKARQATRLAEAGFDVILESFPSGATPTEALIRFFDRHYPALPPAPGLPDLLRETSISYLCGKLLYAFEHGRWGCSPSIVPLADAPSRPLRFY